LDPQNIYIDRENFPLKKNVFAHNLCNLTHKGLGTPRFEATLLLPFSVNHNIRIAQDYMAKWKLAWPKLLKGSTLFEWKFFHHWLKCGD
jgi:hypothetical protein